MADVWNLLVDPAPYMPHGLCLLWNPALVWTHLLSDVLTAGAYYSIPVALLVFVQRRPDVSYRWMLVLFALFILACGTTHLLGAWTLWQPNYVLEGAVKAATAAVSLTTAVLLWPMLPRLIALPSPAQLREVNAALRAEVTERERAERTTREANAALEQAVQALRAGEARYATIFNHVSDAVFTLDVLPDGSFRFASANPAFDRDTGLRGIDIIGRVPREVVDPRYADAMEARYVACVASRTRMQYEEMVERDGGPQIWQTALAPVIDPESGRVVQLVGTARNLTEYRTLQEELAQASKLATLGTMAAGIAHEMSQPLNAIRITATDCAMLIDEGGASDMVYLRQGLTTIRDQSARMGGIVDQMRQFGRREGADARPFDPAEPAQSAMSLLAGQLGAACIDLLSRIAPDLPPVTGQADRLQQVVINLLSNARDAIEERRARDGAAAAPGTIRLSIDRVQAGRAVAIAVEDDGIGLADGVADRIFDPFFTTKDGQKGMGLGLSISASIVTAMGGRIEAGRGAAGARFVATRPARPAMVEAAQ